MSTCYVGFENHNGSVTYSYVHFDGDPDGVGRSLLAMEPNAIRDAVEGGAMRCILDASPPKPEYLGDGQSYRWAPSINDFAAKIECFGYLLRLDHAIMVYAPWEWQGWQDLRALLGVEPKKAPVPVKLATDPVYSTPTGQTNRKEPTMQTNEIIGYRVLHPVDGMFIARGVNGRPGIVKDEPSPIPVSAAYHLLAEHLIAPGADPKDYSIEPVLRETTPIEEVADELGGLFEDLCKRHGLDLGLDRKQINALLVKDLEAIKAGTASFGNVAGIPVQR